MTQPPAAAAAITSTMKKKSLRSTAWELIPFAALLAGEG